VAPFVPKRPLLTFQVPKQRQVAPFVVETRMRVEKPHRDGAESLGPESLGKREVLE